MNYCNFSYLFCRAVLWMTLILCSSSCYSSGGSTSSASPYVVNAKATITNDSIELNLQLKNNLVDKLVFYPGVLSRDSIVLYISRPKAFGGVVEEVGLIDDPDVELLEIEGGKVFREDIDLEEIFPSLREELTKGELILFWAVKVETENGQHSERFGGYIILSNDGQS